MSLAWLGFCHIEIKLWKCHVWAAELIWHLPYGTAWWIRFQTRWVALSFTRFCVYTVKLIIHSPTVAASTTSPVHLMSGGRRFLVGWCWCETTVWRSLSLSTMRPQCILSGLCSGFSVTDMFLPDTVRLLYHTCFPVCECQLLHKVWLNMQATRKVFVEELTPVKQPENTAWGYMTAQKIQ